LACDRGGLVVGVATATYEALINVIRQRQGWRLPGGRRHSGL